jgi:hypothetical protein
VTYQGSFAVYIYIHICVCACVNIAFASKFYLHSRTDTFQATTNSNKLYIIYLLFPVTIGDGHNDDNNNNSIQFNSICIY